MIETKTKIIQTKTKLVVDVLIFSTFLVAMDPRSTGIAIHEWLATATFAALMIHLLLSWDWIMHVTRRMFGSVNRQTRLNYLLNWALFFDVTVLIFSGLMISESVVPALGISFPKNFAWRSLHELTSNLFMILLGFHTALHWSWIVNTFKRHVFQPIGKLFTAKDSRKDITA